MMPVEGTDHKELQRASALPEDCPSGVNGCGETTIDGITFSLCCCNSQLCNGATPIQKQFLVFYLIMGIVAIITNSWF